MAAARLTCSCRRPRCPQPGCGLCSRCGCDHDGVAVALKVARGPGQHGKRKAAIPSPDRDLRAPPPATVTYAEVDSDDDDVKIVEDDSMKWKPRLQALVGLLDCDITTADLAQVQEHVTVDDSQQESGSYRHRQWSRSARIVQTLFVALCKTVCPDAAEAVQQEVVSRLHQPAVLEERQTAQNRRVVENVIVPLSRLPRGCIERKVLLAAASCLSENTLRTMCHSLGDADARLFSQETLAIARQHQQLLLEGHVLPVAKRSQARGSDSVLQTAVQFILDPDRAVKLAHGEITLPDGSKAAATVRTKSVGSMWEQYCAAVQLRENRIGRARFYGLAQAMTSAKQSARGSIDTFYAEYGLLTRDRLVKMIEQLQQLLDPVEAVIIIPPLRTVSDFVFKFLHDEYRGHMRLHMAACPDPPPPEQIASFRSRHKYQTLPQHVPLPSIVTVADQSDQSDSEDSESVGESAGTDDLASAVSSSSGTEADDDLDQQLTAALNASLRPLTAAERLAARQSATASAVASRLAPASSLNAGPAAAADIPIGIPVVAVPAAPIAPLPDAHIVPPPAAPVVPPPPVPAAALVQIAPPAATPHDCCHDPYAALVGNAVGVAASACEACNACEQLFAYVSSRIALVPGAAPIVAAHAVGNVGATNAAVAAADDPDRARKTAQLLAATERLHINYRCWRAHMVRSIVQGDAVDQAMATLSPDTALLLMDFKVRSLQYWYTVV